VAARNSIVQRGVSSLIMKSRKVSAIDGAELKSKRATVAATSELTKCLYSAGRFAGGDAAIGCGSCRRLESSAGRCRKRRFLNTTPESFFRVRHPHSFLPLVNHSVLPHWKIRMLNIRT
jgi:hypothetical protein